MTLLSPLEDFQVHTLSALKGSLARLNYIVSLRDPETGRYRHWGMERVHGTVAAQKAIRCAHEQQLLEVLRTPLHRLSKDIVAIDSQTHVVLDKLARPESLPEGTIEPSRRHFNSVLLALRGLAIAMDCSNPPAA